MSRYAEKYIMTLTLILLLDCCNLGSSSASVNGIGRLPEKKKRKNVKVQYESVTVLKNGRISSLRVY